MDPCLTSNCEDEIDLTVGTDEAYESKIVWCELILNRNLLLNFFFFLPHFTLRSDGGGGGWSEK